MIRVAINGFGRIGRLILRAGLLNPNIQFVAINDLTDTHTLAHLLKYDSVHGKFDGEICEGENELIVKNNPIKIFSQKEPENLPWKELNIDVVVECTGLFRNRVGATKHLTAGAKKVLISSPSPDPDITLVKGVNEHEYNPKIHHIISNASCTTNCLAPVVKILDDNFSILRGYMTTVHADTNDQKLLDLPHKDLRRARAAASSIIPTTTGAASAVAKVIPHLAGKLDGLAMRVPILDGSITDFVCELERTATKEELNKLFASVAENEMKGVLSYTEEPLVSVDIINNPHSCIVDGLSTKSMGKLIKIIAWYDNEWGYSCRMVDMIEHIAR